MDDGEFGVAGSFDRYVGHLPAAFAVTSGPRHTLVYANAYFRTLLAPDSDLTLGHPISDALEMGERSGLPALLDRAFRTGVVARNRQVEPVATNALLLRCTVWPDVGPGGTTDHLVIEMRAASHQELKLGLQRSVAERLLLSALRDKDLAAEADELRRGASFLAAESRRLAESLDETATLAAIKRLSLPRLGAWCIVDTLADDGTMHRLAIIHPDPAKQAILDGLGARWVPGANDDFGLPAALRNATPVVITENVDAVFANAVRDPDVLAALRALDVGALLTVSLCIGERVIGAVTFVSDEHGRAFTPDDLQLARDLGMRSAMALDRARLYGDAIAMKAQAESASEAKSAFLGMISHELRTPLNAIGGYADLIDMELRGPVTEQQHVDLGRIRASQQYLMTLVSDLLNLTQINSGQVTYDVTDFLTNDAIDASLALVSPLIAKNELTLEDLRCNPSIVVQADRNKVIQILVNLLSNGIKFSQPGGRLGIACHRAGETATIVVFNTGAGIPADMIELIFEPFVQVKDGLMRPEGGIGLGLAISRRLALAMRGGLTAESTPGHGARFTLTLPVAPTAVAAQAT